MIKVRPRNQNTLRACCSSILPWTSYSEKPNLVAIVYAYVYIVMPGYYPKIFILGKMSIADIDINQQEPFGVEVFSADVYCKKNAERYYHYSCFGEVLYKWCLRYLHVTSITWQPDPHSMHMLRPKDTTLVIPD